MAGCIAYAGKGFSAGVLHMLRASTRAAYCLPVADQGDTTADTKELDHLLAMHFGWWDVFVGKKKPVSATSATTAVERQRVDRGPRSHRHLPERPRLPALAPCATHHRRTLLSSKIPLTLFRRFLDHR